jgi:muramidase (phage lysozyme)
MKLTRAEAIDLAVRRHMRAIDFDPKALDSIEVKWVKSGANLDLKAGAVGAIRAHFRAICRTYEVTP